MKNKNDTLARLASVLIGLTMIAGIAFSPPALLSQVRSGVGFLKLPPGARQSGISGSVTGALDFTDTFYTNPGATGFLRDWQWSASYTNWISDLYHASFLYGRQFRSPWSRRSTFALGLSYLGVPKFDSSDGASPLVSGNDMLVTASFGQPLSLFSDYLSLGGNVKYYRSELADYNASTVIFDVGLLYRTPLLQLGHTQKGFLDFAILSGGLAYTNLGGSLTYVSESTPLPRMLRAGLGLNLGSHEGLQLGFSTDYRQLRDESGFFSIGSELSWSQLVSLRFGYSFEENLLGNYSFGASFRLDDRLLPFYKVLPGRNNALRFDLAANQGGDFSSSPFQGSVSHFPVGPGGFRLVEPVLDAAVDTDSVRLAWESSRDADLYDEVNYWLLVDPDSLKLHEAMAAANQSSEDLFYMLGNNRAFAVKQQLTTTSSSVGNLSGGRYYWSVVAYDSDQHIRLGDMGNRNIARFDVTSPDLQITAVDFDYSPWITEDDYQGVLKLSLVNQGNRVARKVTLVVADSVLVHSSGNGITRNPDEVATVIHQELIEELRPGNTLTLEVPWSTGNPGLHEITAEIRQANRDAGSWNLFTSRSDRLYTIPKGSFATYDTVFVQALTNIKYELPYVGKVFFDSTSAEVPLRFTRSWVIEPMLATLARRLKEQPGMQIQLQGTADPNSGENTSGLADARALAVRDTLVKFGVEAGQIVIIPGELLPERRLPKNSEDARGVLQERRRVEIIVDEANQRELFGPLAANFSQREISPVAFSSAVDAVVPLQTGFVQLTSDELMESFDIANFLTGMSFRQVVHWSYKQTEINLDRDWQNTNASYSLVLTDSLDRRFSTRPRTARLITTSIQRERMYFGIAKFALAEPLYNFYWGNLLERIPDLLEEPDTRLRFIGHACAIGPEPINLTLSQKRARLFYDRFLQDVKETYPDLYDEIRKRVDEPEAFGETVPFTFKGPKGEVILLGDNQLPTGRQLNRRVIALIYSNQ